MLGPSLILKSDPDLLSEWFVMLFLCSPLEAQNFQGFVVRGTLVGLLGLPDAVRSRFVHSEVNVLSPSTSSLFVSGHKIQSSVNFRSMNWKTVYSMPKTYVPAFCSQYVAAK